MFKNRSEVKQNRAKDDTREASDLTQTYEDRPRLSKSDAVAPPIDLPNFALTINTFTKKVWTYHGDRCPLHEDLLEGAHGLKGGALMNERLKGGALMNERFNFTLAYLRRLL